MNKCFMCQNFSLDICRFILRLEMFPIDPVLLAIFLLSYLPLDTVLLDTLLLGVLTLVSVAFDIPPPLNNNNTLGILRFERSDFPGDNVRHNLVVRVCVLPNTDSR